MADNSVQIAARQWVDSLERKWRLQILSKSYRLDANGNPVERPTRIRRFVEGIPHACVDEAIKYLISLAPYKGVIYNGVLVDGEYVPTKTFWQRDDQAVVNGTSKTDGTYTLFQDLIEKSLWDRYSVGSGLSCSEEVVTDWVWDAPYVEEIPATGDLQGVTWSIQSVSRNEDGSFDYAIVKRTAKTVITPLVTTRVSASETVKTQTWDNVYGEPDTGFKDDTGLPLTDIPTAGTTDDGDRIELSVTKNADCTYKVVATHIQETPSDASYAGAASCSETTDYRHVWGAPEVEELGPHGQGITVSIQSVKRNDNGTYDYVVVTRTAITQDSRWLTHTDNAVEKVEVRTWDNAYGTDGSWKDELGIPLEVPTPIGIGSVRVEVQNSENADCTFKIQATKTTKKAIVQSQSSTHTQYDGEHTEVKDGAALPLGNAPDASDGVIKDYESQLQPDGSYKNVEKVKVERPVPESSKSVSVGRRGRRVTVVNTNQLSPADMSSIGIGGSVKSEKTPGKRFTNTITTWDAENPVRAAESCTEDIFHHRHSGTTAGIGSMPSANEHVYGSGVGGLVITRQTDMDEEGSISQTVTNDQEKEVPYAEEGWQVGLTGVTHTVTHRNVSPNSEYYGTVPTYDKLKVGQSLRREKTPGGLYNVVMTEVDKTADKLDTGLGCQYNAFLHSDTTVTSDPSGALDGGHVPAPADGVYYEKDTHLNADGTSTTTLKTNTEVEERNAEVAYQRKPKGLITRIVDRNVSDSITAPDESHAGDSVEKVMTNGKLYNITKVTLTPSARPDHYACAKTIFEHSDDVVTMGSGAVDTAHVDDAGNGVYHQKTSDLDSDGFVRTTDRTISEIPVEDAQVRYSADRFTKTKSETQKNQKNPTITVPDFLADDAHAAMTVSASKNPGGSVDVTTEIVEKKYRHWDHEVDTNWRYSRTVWFVNATESEKDNLYTEYFEAFNAKMDVWTGDDGNHYGMRKAGNNEIINQFVASSLEDVYRGARVPVAYNISPSVTQNANGLYDGSFTFTANWDMDSAGQTGTLNCNFFWWSYTDRAIQASPNASSSGHASMVTTTIDRHVYCATGRGVTLLAKLLLDSAVYFQGTHMDINPVTQVWHVTLVNSCNITTSGTGV